MTARLADLLDAVAMWPDRHRLLVGAVSAGVAVVLYWTLVVRRSS